ncbi:MAG: porin family protein [Acidobacteria bacterium]|nr:porin family protein [Acidobacteriota bacterium]
MTSLRISTICGVALCLTFVGSASAQTWSGPYIGGTVGAGLQREDASESVTFDTNLDGMFGDTVRTAAGADAFSPGFCAGIAMGAQPSAGCADDEDGIDVGVRVGYDRQLGHMVIGALIDLSRVDVTDGVSAFSTTPAFYAFSRELTHVVGLRGRVGFGSSRVLVYGTAGGAWGGVEHLFTTSNGVNSFVPAKDVAHSEKSWGYQAGGGVELMLGSHWSLTGEYLFTSLDDGEEGAVRSQGPAPATNPFILVNASGTDLRRTDRFEFQTARAGLSYRF